MIKQMSHLSKHKKPATQKMPYLNLISSVKLHHINALAAFLQNHQINSNIKAYARMIIFARINGITFGQSCASSSSHCSFTQFYDHALPFFFLWTHLKPVQTLFITYMREINYSIHFFFITHKHRFFLFGARSISSSFRIFAENRTLFTDKKK